MSERSISESGRWDRRRSSARFLAVSWFVEFRFVAGGDDADDFCGFLIVIGVDDREQDDSFSETDGVPSGFTIFCTFDERDATWIIEDQLGNLEIDAVLDEVRLVFVCIPLEAEHLYVQISTYVNLFLRGFACWRDREFRWNSIVRVCFSDGGMAMSDVLFLDVLGHEKPLLLPLEAWGRAEFRDELCRRDHFPRQIFDRAIRSTDGGT